MPLTIAILTTDKREHEKDYANPMPTFGTAPEALLQGFTQLSDVEVHVVSCVQQPVQSPEKLANNIWYHALHVPKTGWMRTLYQGCIRATQKKLREIHPDIVHGQGTERDCAVSAVLSGFPNVLTIHGNMRLVARVNGARPFSFYWLAGKLERLTVPRSNGIVCITNYTRDAVAGLAKRTWVVPNAVDAQFFFTNPPRNLDQVDPPIILCVGLVCLRKNQNAFIQYLDPLAQRHKFKIVFLGHTVKGRTYDEEFFHLVQSRPWCAYAGFADRDKLKSWLEKSSMLALPSLEDNCPMVILEAMAAGVPVLAARVGGVPDLIGNWKNGLLFDPLNAESVRTEVARLLENPELGRQLSAVARTQAEARFHPLVISKRHLEIYREVLSRPS